MVPSWLRHPAPRGVFLAVCIAGALLAVGGAGLEIVEDHAETVAAATASTEGDARLLEEHVLRALDGGDLLIQHVADRIAELGVERFAASRTEWERLRRTVDTLPQVSSLVVADRDGRVLVTASAFPTPSHGIGERAYFRAHRDGAASYLGAAVISKLRGQPSFTVSRRMNDPDGGFAGVIVAVFEIDYFSALYAQLAAERAVTIGLYRDTGEVVARQPIADADIGRTLAGSELFRDHLPRAPQGAFVGVSPHDGVRRIIAYRRAAAAPLVVTASVDLDQVLAGWRQRVLRNGGILLVALVTLGGLAALGLRSFGREADARRATENGERFLRTVLDSMGAHIAILDAAGTVVATNRAWGDFAALGEAGGGPRDGVGVGANYLAACDAATGPGAEGGRAAAAGIRAVLDGRREEFVLPYACHSAREQRWFQLRVKRLAGDGPPHLVVSHENITSIIKAEEALRVSESRHRLLAENATDLVARLDPELRFLYASAAAREILGFEPAALIGRPVTLYCHPGDVEPLLAALRSLRPGAERVTVQYRARRQDGGFPWVEAAARLVADPGTGQPVEIVMGVRDIARRKRVEEELAQAREEAERANRAKSDFLALVSHQVRTPASSVIGFADLLLDTPLNEEQRHFAGNARVAARALLTVMDEVLDFARLESGRIELAAAALAPRELADACGALMAGAAAAKGLTLRVSVAPEVPARVLGDADRLRQVLLSLLSNAVKFTRQGGVALTVAPADEDGGGGCRGAVGRLKFAVTDSGEGMPAQECGRLFQRYARVDPAHGSVGLGLAIAQRVVALMGGEIGVLSTPGVGSTFWFTVPLPAAGDAVAGDAGGGPAPVRARVLLAEDQPMNQELAATMLRRAGHSVDVVAEGAAAVAAMHARPYDLILMDVRMPVMDGLAATVAVRSLAGPGRDVPIIGMTANVVEDEAARCREAGMDDLLFKPVERDGLLAAVAAWAGRRHLVERDGTAGADGHGGAA